MIQIHRTVKARQVSLSTPAVPCLCQVRRALVLLGLTSGMCEPDTDCSTVFLYPSPSLSFGRSQGEAVCFFWTQYLNKSLGVFTLHSSLCPLLTHLPSLGTLFSLLGPPHHHHPQSVQTLPESLSPLSCPLLCPGDRKSQRLPLLYVPTVLIWGLAGILVPELSFPLLSRRANEEEC